MQRYFLIILILPVIFAGCLQPTHVITNLPPPVVPPVTSPKPPPPQVVIPPPKPQGRSIKGAVIVIDAGHGGKDPGAWKATKSRVPEKTIVLDIAMNIGSILSSRGASVVYTRKSDVYPELSERAALAESSRADLFVSIHADSIDDSAISGTKIFRYLTSSLQSQRAAQCVFEAFRSGGIDCRGMQAENYYVLREHSRPAILIECGYLTNSRDAGMLNTPAYRSRLAGIIAEGIVDYISRYGS